MSGSMKVFLVLLLVGCTHGQGSQGDSQCVSREEFDRVSTDLDTVTAELDTVTAELNRVNAKLLGIKDELDVWQETTIDILKRYLLENRELLGASSCNTTAEPGLAGSLSQLQTDVQDIQQQVSTINNNSLYHEQQQQELQGTVGRVQETLQGIQQQVSTINNNSLSHVQQQQELIEGVAQEASISQLSNKVQAMCNVVNNATAQQAYLEQRLQKFTQDISEIKANQYTPVIGTFQNPAISCNNLPVGSHYWIQSSSAEHGTTRVYCDLARSCCNSTGGWIKVADIDMTDPTQHCPPGFRMITSPKRTCGGHGSGCVSATFPVHGVQYSRVCGRIIAYQFGSPDAFSPYFQNRQITINGFYVEGVSLTHGQNPRKHIWTFAAAVDEILNNVDVCPCTRNDTTYIGVVPPFIGQDYFCDTGSRVGWQNRFYSADPLWDGAGCGGTSTCCTFNNPPWFCKQLPQPTTNDIELRLCTDEPTTNEDIAIEITELFVQ